MSRSIDAATLAALATGTVRPAFLAKIGSASGDVLAWTGIGPIVYAGDTYQGVGYLGGISEVEENSTLEANGVRYTLSGIPTALLATAIGDMRQGLPAKLWLALVDSNQAIIGQPIAIFDGLTDVPSVDEAAETCTISVTAENRLIEFGRSRARRYTPEDQKLFDPADLGFAYVSSLQDKQIVFGKTS